MRARPAWAAGRSRPPARRWRRRRRLPRPRTIVYAVLLVAALPQVGDYAVSFRPMSPDCRVTQIVDGDTVWMSCPGEGSFRARLTGFDAPEVFSPGCATEAAAGYAATQKLRWLVWSAGSIEFRHRGTDRYDRRLVEMRVDGRDVAELMVAAGLARRYDGGARGGWC